MMSHRIKYGLTLECELTARLSVANVFRSLVIAMVAILYVCLPKEVSAEDGYATREPTIEVQCTKVNYIARLDMNDDLIEVSKVFLGWIDSAVVERIVSSLYHPQRIGRTDSDSNCVCFIFARFARNSHENLYMRLYVVERDLGGRQLFSSNNRCRTVLPIDMHGRYINRTSQMSRIILQSLANPPRFTDRPRTFATVRRPLTFRSEAPSVPCYLEPTVSRHRQLFRDYVPEPQQVLTIDPRYRNYGHYFFALPEFIEPLLRKLSDGDGEQRRAAVEALSRYDDGRVFTALQQALKDPFRVELEPANAPADGVSTEATWYPVRQAAYDALQSLRKHGQPQQTPPKGWRADKRVDYREQQVVLDIEDLEQNWGLANVDAPVRGEPNDTMPSPSPIPSDSQSGVDTVDHSPFRTVGWTIIGTMVGIVLGTILGRQWTVKANAQ